MSFARLFVSSPAKRPDRGDARRAQSASPFVSPTRRSAIISPGATSTGRTPPRDEIFVSAAPTLYVFPSPSISSPRRRLGPSPLDRGPGVGRSDRPYLGFLGGARRAAQGPGHCAGKPV